MARTNIQTTWSKILQTASDTTIQNVSSSLILVSVLAEDVAPTTDVGFKLIPNDIIKIPSGKYVYI